LYFFFAIISYIGPFLFAALRDNLGGGIRSSRRRGHEAFIEVASEGMEGTRRSERDRMDDTMSARPLPHELLGELL